MSLFSRPRDDRLPDDIARVCSAVSDILIRERNEVSALRREVFQMKQDIASARNVIRPQGQDGITEAEVAKADSMSAAEACTVTLLNILDVIQAGALFVLRATEEVKGTPGQSPATKYWLMLRIWSRHTFVDKWALARLASSSQGDRRWPQADVMRATRVDEIRRMSHTQGCRDAQRHADTRDRRKTKVDEEQIRRVMFGGAKEVRICIVERTGSGTPHAGFGACREKWKPRHVLRYLKRSLKRPTCSNGSVKRTLGWVEAPTKGKRKAQPGDDV
ncbi:hypothetical protein BV25DRAFT_1843605 [Artomyces pyxidatus]|uniref:Uncharacterized protein n=1 Tax=Artomyces pyxidatus TaxID=48021 RepID=A0ACB8SDH7_9AGAM|nr:hypothetical protein BV25DRAFT_1843605 [Artomyces pyxidatus]